MATEKLSIEQFDPDKLPGLKTDRTTDQVLADIVADSPEKHGMSIEERKRRAVESAKRAAEQDAAFFDESEGGHAD